MSISAWLFNLYLSHSCSQLGLKSATQRRLTGSLMTSSFLLADRNYLCEQGHRRISSNNTAVRKIETGNGWRKLGETCSEKKRSCGRTWQTRAASTSTRIGWIWKEPWLQKRQGEQGLECSEAGSQMRGQGRLIRVHFFTFDLKIFNYFKIQTWSSLDK